MTTTNIHRRDGRIWYHGQKIRVEIPKEWAESLGFNGRRKKAKLELNHSSKYGFYFAVYSPNQPKQGE